MVKGTTVRGLEQENFWMDLFVLDSNNEDGKDARLGTGSAGGWAVRHSFLSELLGTSHKLPREGCNVND